MFSFIMTAWLLLILFIGFVHDVKAEALLQPELTVDRPVITETDSVTLTCVTPSSVSVSRCDFFIQNQKSFDDSSCVQILTGAELLKLANKRLPAEVEATCLYRVKDGVFELISPDSATTNIIINNLHPPTLTVTRDEITETDSLTLNCVTPSAVSVTECYFIFVRGKPAKRFSCLKTLKGSKLLSLTQQSSPAEVDVTCSYLSSHRSPESNTFSIIVQSSRPELRVNPSLITETDSVTVNCVTPSSVSVNQCHLYFMRSKTSRSISCVQTLTGSELLSLTSQSSPVEVELRCYYTVKLRGGRYQSPDSNITSVSIQTSFNTDVVRTDSSTSQTAAVSVTTDLTVSSPTWSTKSFFSTSLTSVKPASDPTVSTAAETSGSLSTSQRSLEGVSGDTIIQPVSTTTPAASSGSITEREQKLLNKISHWVRVSIVAAPCFGVAVGLILLGGTLLCFSRQRRRSKRTENYFYTRSQSNFPGDVRGLNSDNNRMSPVKHDSGYNMVTYVPAADSSMELQPMNRQTFYNENADVYHIYTIIDEPALPTDTTYCTLQAH